MIIYFYGCAAKRLKTKIPVRMHRDELSRYHLVCLLKTTSMTVKKPTCDITVAPVLFYLFSKRKLPKRISLCYLLPAYTRRRLSLSFNKSYSFPVKAFNGLIIALRKRAVNYEFDILFVCGEVFLILQVKISLRRRQKQMFFQKKCFNKNLIKLLILTKIMYKYKRV